MEQLADILGGDMPESEREEPKGETTDAPPASENEAKPEEPEAGADTPAEAEKPAEPVEEPAEPKEAPTMVPLAAKQAEKARREAAEQRVRELEAQQAEKEAPDPLDDPEGFRKHQTEEIQRLNWQTKAEMSEAIAKQAHEDYDEVFVVYAEQAKDNPALVQQVMQAAHPAEEAYKIGKQMKAMQEIGDPTQFGDTKFNEGYAKAKAEADDYLKAVLEGQNAAQIPPSLAGQQSIDGRGGAGAPTHTPLEDMLG